MFLFCVTNSNGFLIEKNSESDLLSSPSKEECSQWIRFEMCSRCSSFLLSFLCCQSLSCRDRKLSCNLKFAKSQSSSKLKGACQGRLGVKALPRLAIRLTRVAKSAGSQCCRPCHQEAAAIHHCPECSRSYGQSRASSLLENVKGAHDEAVEP